MASMSLSSAWPPCTITAVALISDTASQVSCRDLADGMRMRLSPMPIDQVRRVDVQRHARLRFQRLGVVAWLGLLPALRVAEEELHHSGAVGFSRCDGVV
jgi:hypothetical protein